MFSPFSYGSEKRSPFGIVRATQESLHADTQAYIDRVSANGGSLLFSEINIVDKFVKELYSKQLRDKFYFLWLPFGDGLDAALTPLYPFNGVNKLAMVGTPFTAINWNRTQGLSSTGVQGLNLGITASQIDFGNHHSGFFVRNTLSATVFAGLRILATLFTYQYHGATNTGISFRMDSNNTGNIASVSHSRGFILGNAPSLSSLQLWNNGSLLGSSAVNRPSSNDTTVSFHLYRRNDGFAGTATCSFFCMGTSLTSSQIADINSILTEAENSRVAL